jgi:hypothetical protein
VLTTLIHKKFITKPHIRYVRQPKFFKNCKAEEEEEEEEAITYV